MWYLVLLFRSLDCSGNIILDCVSCLRNMVRQISIFLMQIATSVVMMMGKIQIDKLLQRPCHNHRVQMDLNIMTSWYENTFRIGTRGIHRSPVDSQKKRLSNALLYFCFILAWINFWTNSRVTGMTSLSWIIYFCQQKMWNHWENLWTKTFKLVLLCVSHM